MSNDFYTAGVLPWFEVPGLSKLQTMLIRAGWERVQRVAGAFEIWGFRTSEARLGGGTVVVPLDPTKEDYSTLYERAEGDLRRYLDPSSYLRLEALLNLEQQRDLVSTAYKRSAATTPGTIPWLAGESMHASIAGMLAASAKSTVDARAQFGRSNSYVANDFLENTILAPSGVGSYVVTALTPIHQPIFTAPPSAVVVGQKVRERHSVEAIAVVRTLDTALTEVKSALGLREVRDSVAAMTSAVRRGVSYELVTALAGFIAGTDAAIVIPRHVWLADATAHEHVFEPPDVPVLHEAARVLAATAEPTYATLTGLVTLMKHEPESDDRAVHLFTTSRGPVRRVRLRLDEDTYLKALEAHRSDALVRVTGKLAKPGKFWQIEFPEGFDVLTAAEADAEVDAAEGADLFTMLDDNGNYAPNEGAS